MMASRKSGAGVSRPKQTAPKKGGMLQLALVAAGIVAVIVVLFLLVGRGRERPSARRTTVASGEESEARKPRKSRARPARTARSSRVEEREKRREERLQRRQESRAGRTSRSATGGYGRSGPSRSPVSPTRLRAILTDGTGSRLALVGERRLRAGDDVDGRRIVEVTGDAVKVEYRQNTYTVKVGEKLY